MKNTILKYSSLLALIGSPFLSIQVFADDISLENIFNWLKKLIRQLISRYWWLFVFVALGFLTMEEGAHLIIPTD